jgi:serine/threonine protein kinase
MSSEFSAQQYAAMASMVPGRRLAGYVIEEQIGAGGMAVVFRARDETLGRLAALKVLSPALAADQEFRTRFLRESRAVASVEEPHIIPVYGAGEVDGVLYIATRFVAGGDLADALEQAGGTLPPARAAALVEQVAAALDAAHAAGLVHRDVKPGNVLVDTGPVNNGPGRPEHAYLSDFGLSKPALAATGLTATGTFLGTPDYSPPEQIRGLPVDGRGDQYALACLAFVLLAGQPPFRRQETMATLFAHMNDPVPPLSRYRGNLPPAVDAVLGRGLAKEPAQRYASCGEFAAALRDALGPAPAGSRAPVSRPPVSRPPYAPETMAWTGDATQAVQPSRPVTVAAAPATPTRPYQPPATTIPGQGRQPVRPVDASGTPISGPWPPPRPVPPPAAGQGGKLPLVSRSAVIAALAAAAVLLLLFVLHG